MASGQNPSGPAPGNWLGHMMSNSDAGPSSAGVQRGEDIQQELGGGGGMYMDDNKDDDEEEVTGTGIRRYVGVV